jgi:hypothetical protein
MPAEPRCLARPSTNIDFVCILCRTFPAPGIYVPCRPTRPDRGWHVLATRWAGQSNQTQENRGECGAQVDMEPPGTAIRARRGLVHWLSLVPRLLSAQAAGPITEGSSSSRCPHQCLVTEMLVCPPPCRPLYPSASPCWPLSDRRAGGLRTWPHIARPGHLRPGFCILTLELHSN